MLSVSILTQREHWVRRFLLLEGGFEGMVSILTQREHWVRPIAEAQRNGRVEFQSSPSANTGCDCTAN